jgi:hypothetical protein
VSDQRIAEIPVPGCSSQIRAEAPQLQVDWEPNYSICNSWSRKHRWLCVRLVCIAMAVMAFVVFCSLMSHSFYSGPRTLAGPIVLFRTQGTEDHMIGGLVTVALLPLMFAVGVWRNWATLVLSILACLCWVGFGLWLEVIASI